MIKNNAKILLIDVGNTNTLFGIYFYKTDQLFSCRFTTNKSTTIDDFALFLNHISIKAKDISACLISSVVPEINETISESIQKYLKLKPIFVSNKNINVKIKYKNPNEIGADRLVNAVAGIKLYGYPCMIVDIGTATTIDFINEKSEYIGGAILPGIGTTLKALSQVTSKLPRIDFKTTSNLIGKDTAESIQSGIYNGFLGSIEYFRKNYMAETKTKKLKVILSGGYTEIFEKEKQIFDYSDIDLTLKGLKLIYDDLSS